MVAVLHCWLFLFSPCLLLSCRLAIRPCPCDDASPMLVLPKWSSRSHSAALVPPSSLPLPGLFGSSGQKLLFLAGDKRRDELPTLLKSSGVPLDELKT